MKKLIFCVLFISTFIMSHGAYAAKKTIGIIAFDGVLTSDITGPAEVFGTATKQSWFTDYEVKFIGINKNPTVTTEEGLTLSVDTNIFEKQEEMEVLLVPSRYDMDPILKNKALISFIQTQAKEVEWMASNCSGAYVLAEAGLLDGKQATTWAGGESDFQKSYPAVKVVEDQNYVIDGSVITGNGSVVSYPVALKLLSLMSSEKLAQEVFDALQLGRMIASY